MGEKIYWDILDYINGNIYIAATSKGLCYVGTPGQTNDGFLSVIHKLFPAAQLEKNVEVLKPYINEMVEYFKGERKSFSLSVHVKGTPFQEAIWNALKEIPYGKTYSYSDIAQKIGKPAAVRAVGTAIGANPVLITVPCHRVIGKNGAITGYRGGTEMKQYLLNLEKKHGGNSK